MHAVKNDTQVYYCPVIGCPLYLNLDCRLMLKRIFIFKWNLAEGKGLLPIEGRILQRQNVGIDHSRVLEGL